MRYNGTQYKTRRSRGQAATELAVFGAILIFIMGGIVRSAVSAGYQQNQELKAMRKALLMSYQSSQAKAAGRNTAAVLFIEDRLTPDLGKYGPMDRTPFIAQGQGTFSNFLMYPLDQGELTDGSPHIPIMDIYINGKYFTFTTGRMVTKTLTPPVHVGGSNHYKGWDFTRNCPIFYTVVPNTDGGVTDTGVLTQQEACDLNRNDDFTDDPGAPGYPLCSQMSWHWKGVDAVQGNPDIKIDVKNSNYPAYDVDGDRQDETIYAATYSGGAFATVTVFDSQEGDLDLTHDNTGPGIRTGMQNDMAIYTRTMDGTYLKIKEGKAYNPESGNFVRSVSSKDQVEIMQRMFQLSGNTGRMCNGTEPLPPVEACGSCFSNANVKLTCFDPASKMLYIRSRILDKSGHFWRTDVGGGLP